MKKKYILILNLEAEISKKIDTGDKKKDKYYKKLLKAVLKNDLIVREIFLMWLLTDLKEGNFIFRMADFSAELKGKNEIDIIRPVLQSLPREAKEYFLKIFETKNNKKDEFVDIFFSLFRRLNIEKFNFIRNVKIKN